MLTAIAFGIVVAMLSLSAVRGFRFPLGADAPVYLWWARLASVDGLSAVAPRPGVPALLLVLSGTLGAPVTAVTAALEAVLSATIGLGAAVLVRGGSRWGRAAWVLAGILAGTFAVHLATGYLASLAFAALFLAAAALLVEKVRRGFATTVAAAGLLGAGGLTHPIFLALGAGILGLTAMLAHYARKRTGGPNDAAHLAAATFGAGAVLGAGMLALLPGAPPVDAITSKDGFFRSIGLGSELGGLYADRLRQHWMRYVQWASLPLAVAGLWETEGLLRRFLVSWGAVTIAGVGLSLWTGLAPADRFVTFGFVVPILASFGVGLLWRWLRRWNLALAWIVSVALVGAMLAGAAITWWRQEPYMSPEEVAAATAAGHAAASLPPHTPLVFIVDDADATASFLAPRAENVIRASVPPDRIRDVHVYVGRPGLYLANRPTARGDPEFDALSQTYLARIRAAGAGPGGNAVAFVLAPFARADFAVTRQTGVPTLGPETLVLNDPALAPGATATHFRTLTSASPLGTFATSAGTLLLLFGIGFGWSSVTTRDPFTAFALAPAFGIAALILFGIALERLAVPLTGAGPPMISAVAAAGGYLLRWWRRRHVLREVRQHGAIPDTSS